MQTKSRRELLDGRAAAFLLAGIACALVLRRFPPEQYAFYPACPIYSYFHVECPGCGATRALAALLRGDIRQAILDNALFVLGVLPASMAYGATAIRRGERGWPALPKSVIYAGLVIAIAFGVARNLIR